MSSPLRLSTDLKEFVKSLSSHEVEFLLVGAHAVAYHGRARFTEDLDLFIRRSQANEEKLIKALLEFGFPVDAGQIRWFFESPRAIKKLGVKPNLIELLNFLDGLDFDAACLRGEPAKIGEASVSVISLSDLLINKAAVGRPQDLADIHLLRQINNLDSSG